MASTPISNDGPDISPLGSSAQAHFEKQFVEDLDAEAIYSSEETYQTPPECVGICQGRCKKAAEAIGEQF